MGIRSHYITLHYITLHHITNNKVDVPSNTAFGRGNAFSRGLRTEINGIDRRPGIDDRGWPPTRRGAGVGLLVTTLHCDCVGLLRMIEKRGGSCHAI